MLHVGVYEVTGGRRGEPGTFESGRGGEARQGVACKRNAKRLGKERRKDPHDLRRKK